MISGKNSQEKPTLSRHLTKHLQCLAIRSKHSVMRNWKIMCKTGHSERKKSEWIKPRDHWPAVLYICLCLTSRKEGACKDSASTRTRTLIIGTSNKCNASASDQIIRIFCCLRVSNPHSTPRVAVLNLFQEASSGRQKDNVQSKKNSSG